MLVTLSNPTRASLAVAPFQKAVYGSGILPDTYCANDRRLHVPSNADMIIDLDRKRMQAMAAKDIDVLDALLADELVYTHSSARLDTKQSLLANMNSGATVYSSVEPSEVTAQDFGDVVILTGLARIKVFSMGKHLDFGVRFTDAYTKQNGRWQMVVWQSTRLPD